MGEDSQDGDRSNPKRRRLNPAAGEQQLQQPNASLSNGSLTPSQALERYDLLKQKDTLRKRLQNLKKHNRLKKREELEKQEEVGEPQASKILKTLERLREFKKREGIIMEEVSRRIDELERQLTLKNQELLKTIPGENNKATPGDYSSRSSEHTTHAGVDTQDPSNREYMVQHETSFTGSDPSHHKSASPSMGNTNTKATVKKPGPTAKERKPERARLKALNWKKSPTAKERKRERSQLKTLTLNKSSVALCSSEEDDEEELPSQVKIEREPRRKFTRSTSPDESELSACDTDENQVGTGLGLSQQKVVANPNDSKASKPAASKVLQAARPISSDEYSNPYKTAHQSIPRCLAYCGFEYSGEAFRYILSPAFLPAFTKFVRVVEDPKTKKIPPFASIMWFIDRNRRVTPKNIFDFDLDKAWEEYQTLTNPPYKPAHTDDVCKLLAHCLYWLVHKGPERVQKPDDTRERRLREKKKAEAVFRPIEDIPFSENIVVPGLRGLTAFWHERDDGRVECFHRAFQMMLMLWHAVQKEKESTLKKRWETFWQHGKRFANREIDPEKHAPYWMRNPERAQ